MLEPEQVRRYERELSAMLRAAQHDPEAFAKVTQLLNDATALLPRAAQALNADGFSWADIARALGCSRAWAHRQYAVH